LLRGLASELQTITLFLIEDSLHLGAGNLQ